MTLPVSFQRAKRVFENRRARWVAAAVVCVLAAGLLIRGGWDVEPRPVAEDPVETESASNAPIGTPEGYAPVPSAYGIQLAGLEAVRRQVQPGQSLSSILQAHGVGYGTILAAADACKKRFDVRNIQPGRPFCVLRESGADADARYFIYEKNDIDYLVFDLADPVSVTCASKPVEIRERTVGGTIRSSLWEALREQRIDPALATSMAEIYAWTIDFHHLQPGDDFTALLEEDFIDGQSVGIGDIAAVRFHHRGRDHYAFHFEAEDGPSGYFDEKGQSLRKAFLKAPLKYRRISSGYSRRRLHPVTGQYRPHPGIDYAAPTGTPVMSVGDGVVTRARFNRSNGNCISIRHNRVYATQYLHLSRFAKGIAPGQTVRQGDCIGYVGSTGWATGPHLDFRFYVNGQTVNPLTYDMPSANPVEETLLPRYLDAMARLKTRLDALYTEIRTEGKTQT